MTTKSSREEWGKPCGRVKSVLSNWLLLGGNAVSVLIWAVFLSLCALSEYGFRCLFMLFLVTPFCYPVHCKSSADFGKVTVVILFTDFLSSNDFYSEFTPKYLKSAWPLTATQMIFHSRSYMIKVVL